jgi:hypothetical protein
VLLLADPLGGRLGAGLARLVRAARGAGAPPLDRVVLFGSRARGDHDAASDVDVLLVCALPESERELAARWHRRAARRIGARHGLDLQPWTVTLPELARGRRTPMLVDALADGITLWARDGRPVALDFTPEDARYCAACLLDWVADGGARVRRWLEAGARARAAERTRDDIVRLATAALLLLGHTRHRRRGSLADFDRLFVDRGLVPHHVRPALRWAAAAFPPDDGRGCEHAPVTPVAVATADIGYRLATHFGRELLPLLERGMRG